jgi:Zn-dependent peptidase ImmA (M78 family)
MTDLKKNVTQIRKLRGLTQAQLSTRLGMAEDELSSFLDAPPKRKEKVVQGLARELLVPDVALFASHVQVPDSRLPDFRLSHPTPGGYSRATLRWIDFAKTIHATAGRIADGKKSRSLSNLVDSAAAIPKAAAQLRDRIELTDEIQINCKSPRFLYALIRQKIEELNVFVLQLSFPERDGTGFSICGDLYDVIVINTRNQIPARRSFTLAHEIYHCVWGKSGLSDSRIENNAVEKRCNSFAAHFLAPDDLVRKISNGVVTSKEFRLGELKQVAGNLNISMHATLLRLVQVGIYGHAATEAWEQYIKSKGDPEFPKKGGGKRVDEWKYKLSKYGYKFATIFGAAKKSGHFDDLELYQLSGIKPKYQLDYLKKASAARPEDSAVDEVDDNA